MFDTHKEYIYKLKKNAKQTHLSITGDVFLNIFYDKCFFSFLTDAPFVNTSKTTGVMQFHCSLNSNLTINIMPVLQNTQQPKQCELHGISFLAYTLC